MHLTIDEQKIIYEKLDMRDLEDVQNLHSEWFPIDYSQDYYKAILENKVQNFYNLAAVYYEDNTKYILGYAILMKIVS